MDQASIMDWVLRFAWLLIIVQWVDIVIQSLGIKKNLLPAGINLSSRESVKSHLAMMSGGSQVVKRGRALLESYSNGWDTAAVVKLLEHQSIRENLRLSATGLFILLVLVSCVTAGDQPMRAWLSMGILGGTLFIKGLLLGRTESILEHDLVTKLPATGNGAAALGISGDELAKALSGSIESAFKNYVPNPEKLAAAITGAVDGIKKAAQDSVEGVNKKLVESQSALVQKLSDQEKSATGSLEGVRKAMEAASTAFSGSLTGGADKLQSSLSGGVDKLQAALNGHVQQLDKATQALSSQLEKISALGKEIEKVLHVQQTVESSMKSVSTSEEFKKTLSTLQAHLQESDKLLREVNKPRTIRLVEQES